MSNSLTVITKGPNGKNKTFNVKVEPHVNVEAALNNMAAAAVERPVLTNPLPPASGGRRNKRKGTHHNKRKGTRRNKRRGTRRNKRN